MAQRTQGEPTYRDLYSETWRAFSSNKLLQLKDFVGKRVCIRDSVFALLPRLQSGLYFNMYLVSNTRIVSLSLTRYMYIYIYIYIYRYKFISINIMNVMYK